MKRRRIVSCMVALALVCTQFWGPGGSIVRADEIINEEQEASEEAISENDTAVVIIEKESDRVETAENEEDEVQEENGEQLTIQSTEITADEETTDLEITTEESSESFYEAESETEQEVIEETEEITEEVIEQDIKEDKAIMLTTAHFAILNRGYTRPTVTKSEATRKYTKVGDGKIYEATLVENDDEAVAANIAEAPDVTKYLEEGEHVVWYVVKKEVDGWHVDGEIVKDKEEEPEQPIQTTTVAHFALLNRGCTRPTITKSEATQKYTKVGDGKIYEATLVENDDEAVAANIAEAPDVTKYLEEGEYVVWYVVKKEVDGWHVDGEIVKEQITQPPLSEHEIVYGLVKEALINHDYSNIDIEQYRLTENEVDEIWEEVKQDYYLEYIAHGNVWLLSKKSNGYVKYCYLYNISFLTTTDTDYFARLERVKASAKKYMNSIDPRMTDVEKLLLAHEQLVEDCTYEKNGLSSSAAGALGNGKAMCSGYSQALKALCHLAGITADTMPSADMDHEWVYVELDGEWYHVDPTWDDTRKGTDEIYRHRYLIRNDAEFETINSRHSGWYQLSDKPLSTSVKYTDWFVHDVAGRMYYYDGLWYYQDITANTINAATIDGTVRNVVIDTPQSGSKVRLTGLNGNVLQYTVDGITYTKEL